MGRMRTSAAQTAAVARRTSLAERVVDGIVHGVGLVTALVAGSVLLTLAAILAAPLDVVLVAIYLATLLLLFSASLAYNLAPFGRLRNWLARLDQAAIFLFIAGTYTPLLAAARGPVIVDVLLVVVWATALAGVALKLTMPERFGRIAIILYLAIGWSGLMAFGALADALPAPALWLIVAGGLAYTAGIVFHLRDAMLFKTAVWHGFVVLGAVLHLIAIYFTLLAR